MNVKFIPECFADTALVHFFLKNDDLYIHQRGVGEVANSMKSKAAASYRIIGIVDNDKRQPSYFQNFEAIETKGSITVKKIPQSEQYLIVLNPAIERFLLNCCQEIGLDLSTFNLPDDLKALTKITKDVNIKTNSDYQNLLNALLQEKSPDFVFLEQIFKGLKVL